MLCNLYIFSFFFFNDTATTEIYTLSLHDALPISNGAQNTLGDRYGMHVPEWAAWCVVFRDRKSTRLNSSHQIISYAVFCLKKKNNKNKIKQANYDTDIKRADKFQIKSRSVVHQRR